MSSEALHEPPDLLSEKTKNLHRAIVSLIEELEAVDWYTQRAEACSDAELKGVLIHHRNEEIEHAMMNLEWIRRNESAFDERMHTFLFKSEEILKIEEAEKAGASGEAAGGGGQTGGRTLGVGSLRLTGAEGP